MTQQTFFYAADFTAVAQAGSTAKTINIEADADFVVECIHLSANFNVGNNIQTRANVTGQDAAARDALFAPHVLNVGGKLYRDGNTIAGAMSSAGLHQLGLMFTVGDRRWMNQQVRADLICGEPGRLFLLPTKLVIPANSVLTVTLYNNLPAAVGGQANPTVDAEICLCGYKQRQ